MAVCWEEAMTAVPFPDTHFHNIAALRDEHAATFHSPLPSPPCVTPGMNLPRYYTPTLRFLLSLLLYISSCYPSLSGFSHVRLWLSLSICLFIFFARIHLRRMLLSWPHQLSGQWYEIILHSTNDFQQYTHNTHRHTQPISECWNSLWYNTGFSFLSYWQLVNNESRKRSDSAIIHQVRTPLNCSIKKSH